MKKETSSTIPQDNEYLESKFIDDTSQILSELDGKTIVITHISETPDNASEGSLYFSHEKNKFYIYTNRNWVLVDMNLVSFSLNKVKYNEETSSTIIEMNIYDSSNDFAL